jgi:hypothetical protein
MIATCERCKGELTTYRHIMVNLCTIDFPTLSGLSLEVVFNVKEKNCEGNAVAEAFGGSYALHTKID